MECIETRGTSDSDSDTSGEDTDDSGSAAHPAKRTFGVSAPRRSATNAR
jgi:hypothetical protein